MRKERYIDIHSHILPGIDDGSESMDETIRMLHIAANEGITTIIATPHYEAGRNNYPVEHLRYITKQVQHEADKIDKDFRIFLGNELYYSESIVEDLKSGKALTLAGSRYVLVEFPCTVGFKAIYRGLNKFIYNGYIPILAHVERYHCIYKRPELVNELVEMGCYTQMNCHSVMGGLLDMEASYNRKLLNYDLIQFVGSDSHSDKERAPMMEKAIKHLYKKCDDSLINKIVLINPRKILENSYI